MDAVDGRFADVGSDDAFRAAAANNKCMYRLRSWPTLHRYIDSKKVLLSLTYAVLSLHSQRQQTTLFKNFCSVSTFLSHNTIRYQ